VKRPGSVRLNRAADFRAVTGLPAAAFPAVVSFPVVTRLVAAAWV